MIGSSAVWLGLGNFELEASVDSKSTFPALIVLAPSQDTVEIVDIVDLCLDEICSDIFVVEDCCVECLCSSQNCELMILDLLHLYRV